MSSRDLLDYVGLVPLLPLFGAFVLLVFGRRLGEPKAGWLATGLVGLSFAWSVVMFIRALHFSGSGSGSRRVFADGPAGCPAAAGADARARCGRD